MWTFQLWGDRIVRVTSRHMMDKKLNNWPAGEELFILRDMVMEFYRNLSVRP